MNNTNLSADAGLEINEFSNSAYRVYTYVDKNKLLLSLQELIYIKYYMYICVFKSVTHL